MKKDSIVLTPAQRQSLEQILSKGTAMAWTLKHAQVLLKVDRGPQGPGWSTAQMVDAYDVSRSTVERICRLFREQGLDAALFRRPQPPRPQKRKGDGEAEAHLLAVLCSQKPEGAERWSLRLVRGVTGRTGDGGKHEPGNGASSVTKNEREALVEAMLVHSTRGQRQRCLPYGRCARRLHSS